MIIDEDEFLEHYGKKGMQWGVKTQKSYSKNRALNKASRAKDKQKKTDAMNVTRERLRPKAAPARNKSTSSGRKAARADRTADIDRARERINSGAARADRKAARAQYKQDRTSMGSREARNILRSSRRELASDAARSREARNGAEEFNRFIDSISRNMNQSRTTRSPYAPRPRSSFT